MKLTKDNPILTAYALGELGPDEAAEVAAAVRADESLQAEVDAIAALGCELQTELDAEPMGELSAFQRATLIQKAEEIDQAAMGRHSPVSRRQRWLAVAAAGLLVAGALGLWVLGRPIGPTGPVMAGTSPRSAPTLSPLGPIAMGTPAPIEDSGFFDPWQETVGSTAQQPAKARSLAGSGNPTEDSLFRAASALPVSTFGLSVNDASYRHVHQLIIEESRLPEPALVRVEELINHFPYDCAAPAENKAEPLAVRADMARCPWAPEHVLLRVVIHPRPNESGPGMDVSEVVATDARARVVFNPAAVDRWRLIGFDGPLSGSDVECGTRVVAGRSLTVLYELAGVRQGRGSACTIRAEYRLPGESKPRRMALAVPGGSVRRFEDAPADFRLVATVAGFGMILRDSPHKGTCTIASLLEYAETLLGDRPTCRQAEFVQMLREARGLLPVD